MITIEKTKIALVQMESLVGDIRSNLKNIEYYIKESYKKKVNIICFPEAAINGYSKDTDPIGLKRKTFYVN